MKDSPQGARQALPGVAPPYAPARSRSTVPSSRLSPFAGRYELRATSGLRDTMCPSTQHTRRCPRPPSDLPYASHPLCLLLKATSPGQPSWNPRLGHVLLCKSYSLVYPWLSPQFPPRMSLNSSSNDLLNTSLLCSIVNHMKARTTRVPFTAGAPAPCTMLGIQQALNKLSGYKWKNRGSWNTFTFFFLPLKSFCCIFINFVVRRKKVLIDSQGLRIISLLTLCCHL